MINPRAYQVEVLESILCRRKAGITRQLVSLPTGCGKTVVFCLLAKTLNVRTLVIAHTQELISQAVAKFQVIWPEVDIGIVRAEKDEVASQVVVASIQTASRDKRLQRLREQDFQLLIIDEAHHSAANSYIELSMELGFLKDNPVKLLVGLTATPKRGDGIGLGSVFQEIVFERSIGTMIRAGYLSSLIGKQVFTKVELGEVGVRNGDFILSELSRTINSKQRNQLIVENYKKYAPKRKKSLVFCVDVQHAKDLAECFNKESITASPVYGAMKDGEREQILSDFSKGKYQVLTNCQLLTEGFDEPSIDCVVMARPTKSSTLFTQMIGRGTRTFPLKRDCFVLDFCDNSSRHSLCNFKNVLNGAVGALFDVERDDGVEGCSEPSEGRIVDLNAAEAARVYRERVEDIEFFDSAQFAWSAVGDSWHLSLAWNRDIWVRRVNGGFLVIAQNEGNIVHLSNSPLPLDYALGVAEDWSRCQTTKSAWARKEAKWREEPPTHKQLETLHRFGISLDHSISRGEAARLLDSKINEPATPKQVFWLKRHGVVFEPSITKFEARKIIGKNMR